MPTEIWKNITIKEFRGTYLLSESGRIKKKGYYLKTTGEWRPDKFLMPKIQSVKKPYLRIILSRDGYKKQFYIHRLVAMFFVHNPNNKPHVNHKDGNKQNNHYTNLEWCTPEENNEHAIKTGLARNPDGRIPANDRQYIIDNFYKIGRYALAKKFNVDDRYVLGIARAAGLSVTGTVYKKKAPIKVKEVINAETGEKYTVESLGRLLKTAPRYINRMLSEERKPNTSPFRYTGNYVLKETATR